MQYILQRLDENDIVWSDTHKLSSTKHIKRRRVRSRGCQGRKRGRHRAGVSVPTSSGRVPPGCQLILQQHRLSVQTFLTITTLQSQNPPSLQNPRLGVWRQWRSSVQRVPITRSMCW